MPVLWPSFHRMLRPHAPTSSASSARSGCGLPGLGHTTSSRSRRPRHSAHWQLTRSSSSPKRETRPSSHVIVRPASLWRSMVVGSCSAMSVLLRSEAMEFGLHLPNAGPFANGPDILRVARAAEDLGYHSVWLFDHLFTPTNLESKYPYTPDGSYPMLPELPFYDPVSVMAALTGPTERIKFGTRVLIPTYRHPVVLAKELGTTDAIAGGRMILGVGP